MGLLTSVDAETFLLLRTMIKTVRDADEATFEDLIRGQIALGDPERMAMLCVGAMTTAALLSRQVVNGVELDSDVLIDTATGSLAAWAAGLLRLDL